MQIRIIIEHKYYSSYQKQIGNYRKERREGVLVSIFTDQERHQISRTHPRFRVIGKKKNKHW
jgi:hypothetical protein